MRRRGGAVVAIIAGLALALAAAEVAMRAGLIKPRFRDQSGLAFMLDTRVLFRFYPNCRADFNSMGFRDREFSGAKTPGKRRVLMLGDSFVMGLHVKPDETIPAAMQAASGGALEVFNMGVYSYGPDQELITLRDEGFGLDPDAVVLVLYPSNDFDDLLRNRIFVADDAGNVSDNAGGNAVASWMPALRSVYLGKYLLHRYAGRDMGFEALFLTLFGEQNNDDTFVSPPNAYAPIRKAALMRHVLQGFRDECAARGVRFVAVVLPSIWNMQEPSTLLSRGWPAGKLFLNEEIVLSTCASEGVECIDMAGVFRSTKPLGQLYDPVDHHLSVYGHKVVAVSILNALSAR